MAGNRAQGHLHGEQAVLEQAAHCDRHVVATILLGEERAEGQAGPLHLHHLHLRLLLQSETEVGITLAARKVQAAVTDEEVLARRNEVGRHEARLAAGHQPRNHKHENTEITALKLKKEKERQ